MKKSVEWLERAEKELRTARDDGKVPNIIFELVNELHVHQTELEMQNEELNRSQRKMSDLYNQYHELYNELPVGYFTLDKKGLIKNVNKKGVELLGLERERIIKQWFGRFIPQDERYKYHQNLTEATNKHQIQEFELKLKRNHSFFNAQIKISPLHEKNNEKYRIIIEDITKRKQIEEAFAKKKEELQTIIDSTRTWIFYKDKENHYLQVNRAYTEILGLSKEELEGVSLFDIFEREQAETYWKSDKQVIKSGKPKFDIIEPMLYKNKVRWVQTDKIPYYDELNNIIGIIGFADDITERKQHEKQLKQSMDKLKRSNEELEQFAYVASHDLQEPLRMVGSFTQLLERRYKGKLDKDADDYIGFIVDGANRMKDLIDDLLAFSRLNTTAKEYKLIDLEKALNDVLLDIQTSVEENNVTITHDVLPTIKCDPSQIGQLFQNLIANAIKFQDEESPIIHISVEESVKEWLFGVSDNGIGIAPEHHKKIFNVFNRLHTRAEYEGTGIGLAICKRIVNRHKGKIWVESELRKGSTFYFTIPKKLR